MLIVVCGLLGLLVVGLTGGLLYSFYQIQQLRKRKDAYSCLPKAFLALDTAASPVVEAADTPNGISAHGINVEDQVTSFG